MSALGELRDAIDHVTTCTGDGEAWKRGLTPTDIGAIGAAVIDPQAVTALLTKIRANHPTLFDPKTGAPVSPAPPPGQRGEAVSAIQKAEDDLAQQNSATAQLDLHVVAAILNAHAAAGAGGERLRALQEEIEDAVRVRTDLDTAAGAREFQRFLIGKLREIAAVVETANLDSASKAALAAAWTALYKSGDGDGRQPPDTPAVADRPAPEITAAPAPAAAAESAPALLPPYGSDISDDELAALLGPAPTTPAAAPAPTAAPVPAPMQLPAAPLPSAAAMPAAPLMSGLSALPSLLPDASRTDPTPVRPAQVPDDPFDFPVEDDPLGDEGAAIDDDEPVDEDTDPQTEPPPAPAADCTAVRLPDGGVVNAPTAALAEVFRSALNGTPVADAFRAAGITVPPPGTAVPHPVAAFRVVGGDVGMFSDRQALALDRDRAWLDGRIQPVVSVGGPSFLGWLHPPSEGAATAPSADQGATPPPTRPAAAGAG